MRLVESDRRLEYMNVPGGLTIYYDIDGKDLPKADRVWFDINEVRSFVDQKVTPEVVRDPRDLNESFNVFLEMRADYIEDIDGTPLYINYTDLFYLIVFVSRHSPIAVEVLHDVFNLSLVDYIEDYPD